ncbi:maleylpyruvate isomerase family mycothiol-dependent enzyme [Nonomuraea purpurea]|uniref:Maleylpyruvate isomerase family mycothiol-dependent enzyme n=1 Tax=Nonomuraea purpurea TaxID=1849276 RepID=A0ABV8GRX5_9ACTN
MDLMQLAQDERSDLAAFLATLSPQQWEAPTLCDGWRVRDVVAHMVSYEELDGRGLLRRFAAGRFLPDRVNAVGATHYATRSPEELQALLAEHLRPRGLTAAFGGRIALTDGLIHHQDIRRPLGLPRAIPPERLLSVLPFALSAPVIRGFWRVRGVRLVATDLNWSTGKGPEARGKAEALLMVIAGRRGVVAELSGPGQPILAGRVRP